MKRIFSLILVAIIGFFIINNLFNSDMQLKTSSIEDRVAYKYITKSVTEDTPEVVFGESKNLEGGSANMVTSIVVNYRSFDTLGEVTVLFVSALGVAIVFGGVTRKYKFTHPSNFILKTGARIVFGLILIIGVFMVTHGHITPGGGFPGGSMIAAAMLLLYLADDDYRAKISTFKFLEGFAGTIYVLMGAVGLLVTNYFLQNFLETGVVGDLLSAGIIPIIYILIGLKVGAELSGIIDNFLSEEVVE